MKKRKVLVTSLALSLTFSAFAPSFASAAAVKTSPKQQVSNANLSINSYQKYIDFLESNPDALGDPALTEEFVSKLQSSTSTTKPGQYETMGKVTLAAKAGAKAIKATMKKIGKERWNNWVDSMEKFYGIPMAYLHYQGITNLVDILSNSDDSFKAAISKYLISKGMNRIMANIITNIFVAFVL